MTLYGDFRTDKLQPPKQYQEAGLNRRHEDFQSVDVLNRKDENP